ncbi:alpha/beta fold hydrolase [Gordonia sp. PKS22-38]|uniref:Alpha/beta fold hydrolase n=1 Tax=Gordonia prachuapensis TaxID=3115651 RepID=A0ABU7MZC7_9ACTN|nr:alpha/beta fold hydrolase [Gordonia sp. PKS22-38]
MKPMESPSVIVSPAMAVPSRHYRRLVEEFARHGWRADVVPRRGMEPDVPPASRTLDWGYTEEAGDLAAAIVEVRRAEPTRPVLVVGHSLGAQLAAMLADGPAESRPDGVVSVAGSVPWFRLYSRDALPVLAVALLVGPVTAVVGHWPAAGFGGPGPRTLMREWARMVRRGRAPFATRPTADVPLLAVRLAGDRLVTAPAAELYESRFLPRRRTVWNYTADDVPEGGSLDHVRWVKTPGAVVDHVVQWWAGQYDGTDSTATSDSVTGEEFGAATSSM